MKPIRGFLEFESAALGNNGFSVLDKAFQKLGYAHSLRRSINQGNQCNRNSEVTAMPLPQDISPVNSELIDTLARSSEMDWIETTPDKAYMKVLWLGPESGRRKPALEAPVKEN